VSALNFLSGRWDGLAGALLLLEEGRHKNDARDDARATQGQGDGNATVERREGRGRHGADARAARGQGDGDATAEQRGGRERHEADARVTRGQTRKRGSANANIAWKGDVLWFHCSEDRATRTIEAEENPGTFVLGLASLEKGEGRDSSCARSDGSPSDRKETL